MLHDDLVLASVQVFFELGDAVFEGDAVPVWVDGLDDVDDARRLLDSDDGEAPSLGELAEDELGEGVHGFPWSRSTEPIRFL